MSLAPTPPPSPAPSTKHCKDNVIRVEALAILAIVAMFLLHVLGSLRRRSSNSHLHGIVKVVDTLSYPLVSYTIGQMRSSGWYYDDFSVWAVFLLLLLGSTDNLTACRLGDIDNWKSIYVKHLFKAFLVVSIVVDVKFSDHKNGQDPHYLWPVLTAILFVGVIKWYWRIASMRMVSKSNLSKNVTVIADYMLHVENLVEPPFDPVTMEGYRYIAAGEKYLCREDDLKKKKATTSRFLRRPAKKVTPSIFGRHPKINKLTTVEEIWQCTGNLLLHDRGILLKDICLSMALSKMLNRRFAGFKLSEAGLEKTHDFVFGGLLTSGEKPHQRVFRVIEEELAFYALCLPIIMFGLCSWLTYELVQHRHDPDASLRDATIFITVVLAFLEAYQLYLYIASGWFKVSLIRSYISSPFLQRSRCCIEKIMSLLLRSKAIHPWKDTLGQYCLLEKLGHQRRSKNFLLESTIGSRCRKAKAERGNSVKLSENVKKAIVDSLLRSNGHLTNGITSLQKNSVHAQLPWACDAIASDGMVTRTILLWHIATTLCKQLDDQVKDMDTVTRVETASTLSQYCMHLLVFAPNLLPDHSSISEPILDQAIVEAGELLGKHNKLEDRCRELMEHSGDEASLLTQGAQLAKHLLKDIIKDPTLRWKVLSEFWAEMMLYVSPSDDARAHLEALAKGGEFITHIWALLTHAGVLKRWPKGPKHTV
ncbi:hypothetical protein BS78_05G276800 [Paspalum vaginatum]|nr:hypothetical protein BS78_05G276800 [Paspalum vaginatum]